MILSLRESYSGFRFRAPLQNIFFAGPPPPGPPPAPPGEVAGKGLISRNFFGSRRRTPQLHRAPLHCRVCRGPSYAPGITAATKLYSCCSKLTLISNLYLFPTHYTFKNGLS